MEVKFFLAQLQNIQFMYILLVLNLSDPSGYTHHSDSHLISSRVSSQFKEELTFFMRNTHNLSFADYKLHSAPIYPNLLRLV